MSSHPPEKAGDTTSSTSPPTNVKSSTGRLVGLFAVALVVACVGWVAYVYITGDGGFSWERLTFQEEKTGKIVEFSGQIYFNDDPLVNGIVQAYRVDGKGGRPSVGPIEADGKFTLYTDINGTMTKGLPVGEYRLVINAIYPLQQGQLGTTKVLPAEYYEKDTTPVSITVKESDNELEIIRLKGTPANPPPSKKPSGKKKTRKFDPEQILRRIMEEDKNSDGKISREEAPDRLKRRFDNLDADKDGLLDEKELRSMFQPRGKKKSPASKKTS